MKNIITYLKRDGFSINRLSLITGYDQEILIRLQRDEIPENQVTQHKGRYIPCRTILIEKIKERMQEFKTQNKSMFNQMVSLPNNRSPITDNRSPVK